MDLILIAPDSYKGTLSASRAARAISAGIHRCRPGIRTCCVPLGDGGEGTVEALVASMGGTWHETRVLDPLNREVTASFALLDNGTAALEMSAASGLTLLSDGERDPLSASTYGTGQLLEAARLASDDLLVGIGGSATVDGGLGMARALGVRFYDSGGDEIVRAGENLARIASVDTSGLDHAWGFTRVRVMCDVDNPLAGERGAACVFGPQKGATPSQVQLLDAGLGHLGDLWETLTGKPISSMPGAGAAGGVGAALAALLGAELVRGAEVALDAVGFDARLHDADAVITGEGRMDLQTLDGKLPVAVARRARRAGVPAYCIPGYLVAEARDALSREYDGILPVHSRPPVHLDRSRASELLTDAAVRLCRTLCIDTLKREDEPR